MKFNIKVLTVWAQWLTGIVVGTIYGIGKFPLDLTGADWKHVFNAVWLSAVPVLLKWANPRNDFTMTVKK